MARSMITDRKATREEVEAHADELRGLAADSGFVSPRLRSDGALVVHDDGPGYRRVSQLARSASEKVGAYVHVITDDVPGASGDLKPL